MWKAFPAIVLGGLGAYAGGWVGLSQADQSVLDDGVLARYDIQRIANYSLYGAIGLPSGALLLNGVVVLASDREFQKRLQRQGAAAVDRLGFGSDVGIAVADALSEIDR